MSATQIATPRKSKSGESRYFAALIITLFPATIIASIITVITYVSISPLPKFLPDWMQIIGAGWLATASGLIITLIIWLLIAFPCRRFTTVNGANALMGGSLTNQLLLLRAERTAFSKSSIASGTVNKIDIYIDEIEDELERQGLCWLLATSYISTWNLLHRMEETFLSIVPREAVLKEALHDELRLQGSSIDNRESLLDRLRLAVKVLSASGAVYLNKQPSHEIQRELINSTHSANLNHTSDTIKQIALDHSSRDIVKIIHQVVAELTNGSASKLTKQEVTDLTKNIVTDLTETVVTEARKRQVKDLTGLVLDELIKQKKTELSDEEKRELGNLLVAELILQEGNNLESNQNIMSEVEARSVIQEVRQTINEFRDNLWEGLVHSRNQVMWTAIITSTLTYILLIIAIISGTSTSIIKSATIFYFVGAIVGLFSRLYKEHETDSAVNDYGLAKVRILVTPVLSGLAAVGSVLIATLLLATSSSTVPYAVNLQNLIIAAIFGLTPNLLISNLQQQAEKYKGNIKSSQASDQV